MIKKYAGVTLIEVLISLFLIMIILLGVVEVMGRSFGNSVDISEHNRLVQTSQYVGQFVQAMDVHERGSLTDIIGHVPNNDPAQDVLQLCGPLVCNNPNQMLSSVLNEFSFLNQKNVRVDFIAKEPSKDGSSIKVTYRCALPPTPGTPCQYTYFIPLLSIPRG